MNTNGKITIYHKGFYIKSKLETWTPKSYEAWFHGGKGASINKGYDNANDVNIRLPYDVNDDLDINNISIGDIIVQGKIEKEIKTQQDLSEYEIYNITSIINNTFGDNKHIHIGGK